MILALDQMWTSASSPRARWSTSEMWSCSWERHIQGKNRSDMHLAAQVGCLVSATNSSFLAICSCAVSTMAHASIAMKFRSSPYTCACCVYSLGTISMQWFSSCNLPCKPLQTISFRCPLHHLHHVTRISVLQWSQGKRLSTSVKLMYFQEIYLKQWTSVDSVDCNVDFAFRTD